MSQVAWPSSCIYLRCLQWPGRGGWLPRWRRRRSHPAASWRPLLPLLYHSHPGLQKTLQSQCSAVKVLTCSIHWIVSFVSHCAVTLARRPLRFPRSWWRRCRAMAGLVPQQLSLQSTFLNTLFAIHRKHQPDGLTWEWIVNSLTIGLFSPELCQNNQQQIF